MLELQTIIEAFEKWQPVGQKNLRRHTVGAYTLLEQNPNKTGSPFATFYREHSNIKLAWLINDVNGNYEGLFVKVKDEVMEITGGTSSAKIDQLRKLVEP